MSRGGANHGRGSKQGRRPPLAPFNDLELAQLRRLTDQAFELRDGPYLVDAVAWLETWYWQVLAGRMERAARERVA